MVVDGRRDDAYGHRAAVEGLLHVRDALRRREKADRRHVVGAAVEKELDRRGQGAAGREHRVEDVALAAGQVLGQPRRVRRRLQGALVADHAEESDLGGRQEPGHAVEHAETGAEDGHDERLRARSGVRPRPGPTGVVTVTSATRTSRVASYARSVTSSSARRRNVGESVVSSRKRRELVGDKGVVGDEGSHIGSR